MLQTQLGFRKPQIEYGTHRPERDRTRPFSRTGGLNQC